MSTPSSPPSRSTHSVEEGTASTKHSPEILRSFGQLTLNDPFVNTSTQATATDVQVSYQNARLPGPVVDHEASADQHNLDLRRHGGPVMGSTKSGEPLTQFILIDDNQSISEYKINGDVYQVMLLGSLWEYCFDPKHPHPKLGRFKVLLRYANTNDVETALEILRATGLNAYCISATRFCLIYGDLGGGQVTPGFCLSQCGPEIPTLEILGSTFQGGYDGQLLVQAQSHCAVNLSPEAYEDVALEVVKDLFVYIYGEYTRIKVADAVSAPANARVVGFVIELFEHKVADHLVNFFETFPNGYSFKGCTVKAMHFRPQVFEGAPGGMRMNHLDSAIRRRLVLPKYRYDHPNFASIDEGACTNYSQFGSPLRHTRDWSYEMMGRFGNPYDLRSSPPTVVKWNAVLHGEDTRTTFMLRNIPSEMRFLKGFIDGFLKFKYDFLYLRIDFTTKKNLGYAFINVSNAKYILPFLRACVGVRWPVPGNNKKVEVSYATMQGTETLISKFRNSAVMLEEDPNSKPHLFWLKEENPFLAGEEKQFPDPDNNQKQQRSEQNALSYGLYAPGQGRRPGRFDRGHPNDYFNNSANLVMPPFWF